MSLAAWRTLAPAIDLTQGTKTRVTIPVFDYTFMPPNRGCLSFTGAALNTAQNIAATAHWASWPLMTDEWSIDCWVKIPAFGVASNAAHIFQKAIGTTKYIKLIVDSDRYFKVGLMVSNVVTTLVSGAQVPIDEWCHVGVTYIRTGGVRSVRLYVNGVAVLHTATIGAIDTDLDTDGGGADLANQDVAVLGAYNEGAARSQMAFKMAMLRMWAIALPAINFYYRNPNAYILLMPEETEVVDGGLFGLWDFATAAPFLNIAEQTAFIGGDGTAADFVTIAGTGVARDADDGFPALCSAESIQVASIPLSGIGQNFSLRYPVTQPENTTYSLFVTWLDDDNISHTKALWTNDDYEGPEVVDYQGERINYASASLMVMSDFYARSAENPVAFDLELSIKASYEDFAGTRPAATALVPTDEIYEPFPIVWDADFDQAQT